MNKKVEVFLETFEKRFFMYIRTPDLEKFAKSDLMRGIVRNFSFVLPATEKLSDWDIYFELDDSKVNSKILKEIRKFIIDYFDFEVIDDLITFDKRHTNSKAYQRIDKPYFLQFMGFLKDENSGPFLDIHIAGLNTELMKDFYITIQDECSRTYIEWCMVTVLRKLMKGTLSDETKLYFVDRGIKPVFLKKDLSAIDKNLTKFFIDYLSKNKKFSSIVDFLK